MHTTLLSTLILINPFSPVSTHMTLRPSSVYKLHKALELPMQNHLNTPNVAPNARLMFLSPGTKNSLALNMLVINQPAVLQSPSIKVFHVWKFACEKFHTIIKNNCHQSCVHLKKIRCACYVSVKHITLKKFAPSGPTPSHNNNCHLPCLCFPSWKFCACYFPVKNAMPRW